MYIRFQLLEIDVGGSNKPLGIFQRAYELRDSSIPEYDREYLRDLLVWFDDHLEEPDHFYEKKITETAISRYKDTAKEHISQTYELVRIYKEYDILAEVVTTSTPGKILYEDEHQILAIPYKTTL